MGHIHHSAVADVPIDVAFAFVDDRHTVPNWMFGITRFEPAGKQEHGLGAVFDVTMTIGPKALKSVVRVTEWIQDEVIAIESVKGMSNASRWHFEPVGDGQTRLTVDFHYNLPGGLAGKALSTIVEPVVGGAIRLTEAKLRAQVEAHHAAAG